MNRDDLIRGLTIPSDVVHDIYSFYKLRKASISNIDDLSRDIRRQYTFERPNVQNDYYGNATVMKRYAGISPLKVLNMSIQHGTYFGEYVWEPDYKNRNDYILVPGHNREEVYHRVCNKKVLVSGTHIAYANSIFDEKKTNQMKQEYGRTLLAFPCHSTHHNSCSYDESRFINEIIKFEKDFDTVMVCMYWRDIQLGQHIPFMDRGWKMVSAGHIYDHRFLDRLCAIFKLGDSMITNGIGDHIGQAIYFDIPIKFCPQKISVVSDKLGGYSSGEEMNRIGELFLEYDGKISKEQYDVCDFYFGSKTKLSREEMRKVLLL